MDENQYPVVASAANEDADYEVERILAKRMHNDKVRTICFHSFTHLQV